MFTKLVSWLIVIGLMNYTMGCTVQKTVLVGPSEKSLDAGYKIESVILNNGEEITFDKAGGRYNPETRVIEGAQIVQADKSVWYTEIFGIKTQSVTIKTEDIKSIRISEFGTIRSIALGISVIAVVSTVAFLIWVHETSPGWSVGPKGGY